MSFYRSHQERFKNYEIVNTSALPRLRNLFDWQVRADQLGLEVQGSLLMVMVTLVTMVTMVKHNFIALMMMEMMLHLFCACVQSIERVCRWLLIRLLQNNRI